MGPLSSGCLIQVGYLIEVTTNTGLTVYANYGTFIWVLFFVCVCVCLYFFFFFFRILYIVFQDVCHIYQVVLGHRKSSPEPRMTMMIVWCFTSLSILFKSYRDDKSDDEMLIVMKCCAVMS